MNIIKTSEALQKWLGNHKVKFGITERINGELPKYCQLASAGPDAAVVVVVLVPSKRDYLDSEIIPFSVFPRSDYPSRPKAQFKESDTELSGAEYLLGAKTDRAIVPAILDAATIDGVLPNTEEEAATALAAMVENTSTDYSPLEIAVRKSMEITNDAQLAGAKEAYAQLVEENDVDKVALRVIMHSVISQYETATSATRSAYRAMSPNGNGIVG